MDPRRAGSSGRPARTERPGPIDAPPTTRWTEHRFKAIVHRTKGTAADGVSPVRVIADPAYLYWPDGPRAGSDDASVSIELDTEVVDVGGALSGRVIGAVHRTVQIGAVLDHYVHVQNSSKAAHKIEFTQLAEAAPDASGAFRFEVPAGATPTFHDGDKTSLGWEIRAAGAWRRFGMLDLNGEVEIPEVAGGGLLDLFGVRTTG